MALLTVLFGLIGLGIIIFVHEFGHFIAAKISGIEVEIFSLGWGKKLVGFTRGKTTYQISWFLIGGFCKMKGEMLKGKLDETEMERMRSEKGSFLAASPWQRAFVSFSGPLANVIFAITVLTFIWWVGFNVHSSGNRIILATDYSMNPFAGEMPADKAGLMTGDRIVAIDDRRTESFWDISEVVRRSPNKSLTLTVTRDEGSLGTSRTLELPIVPEAVPQTGQGRIGIYAWIEPFLASIEASKPGGLAGLATGDRIIAVNGVSIQHDIDFYQALPKDTEVVNLTVQRGNELISRTLQIEFDKSGNLDLGLVFQHGVFRSPQLNLWQAFQTGFRKTAEILTFTVKGIGQLVRLQVSKLQDVVAGPARITKMVGEAATGGFSLGLGEALSSYFQFLCLLSVAIAFINLLPLPALDGGTIVISIFEGLRQRPLKLKLIYRYQIIGFAIIFLIFFTAILSDILFFVG